MVQNRQAKRDRIGAEHDYEVNPTAKHKIVLLHENIVLLRERQRAGLLATQQYQLERLAGLRVARTA